MMVIHFQEIYYRMDGLTYGWETLEEIFIQEGLIQDDLQYTWK